jgi:hypothetical protein
VVDPCVRIVVASIILDQEYLEFDGADLLFIDADKVSTLLKKHLLNTESMEKLYR